MKPKCIKIIPLVMAILMVLSACGAGVPNTVHSPDDLQGKTVGVLENSLSHSYLSQMSGVKVKTFTTAEAMAQELKNGGIDCAVCTDSRSQSVIKGASGLKKLTTPLVNENYRIAVSPENKTLLTNINSGLQSVTREGTLNALTEAWLDGEGSTAEDTPDGQVLKVAVTADFFPMSFTGEEGRLTGLEPELIRAICQSLGVRAEFREVSSDMLLYMVESGKVSLAIGRLSDGGAVSYSDSYLTMVQDIIVRKD